MFYFGTFVINIVIMKLGENLKKVRENKGYTQQQMADLIHTHRSGYSKMENNQQDISVDALVSIAKNFGITVDDVIHFGEKNDVPQEVIVEDKTAAEQLNLIAQLNEEDQQTIFSMIDKMLTNQKFKTFFQENSK